MGSKESQTSLDGAALGSSSDSATHHLNDLWISHLNISHLLFFEVEKAAILEHQGKFGTTDARCLLSSMFEWGDNLIGRFYIRTRVLFPLEKSGLDTWVSQSYSVCGSCPI